MLVKTIRGEREYPSRQEYLGRCVRFVRDGLRLAHLDGYRLEESSAHTEAAVTRAAGDHYDTATVRGEDLLPPESY